MSIAYFTQPDGTNVLTTNTFRDENAIDQVADNFFLDENAQLWEAFWDRIPMALIGGLGHPRYFVSNYPRTFEVPNNIRVFNNE
jgi:hypothetical protein